METGCELDRLVAERVFGLRVVASEETGYVEDIYADAEGMSKPLGEYSADLNEAWSIVDRLHEEGWGFSIAVAAKSTLALAEFLRFDPGKGNFVRVFGQGGTPAEAICRAAVQVHDKWEKYGKPSNE